jgi:hypothetical protein
VGRTPGDGRVQVGDRSQPGPPGPDETHWRPHRDRCGTSSLEDGAESCRKRSKTPETPTFDATFRGLERLRGQALILYVSPAFAQQAGDLFGGDLGQNYANNITNKFNQMTVEEIASDPAYLERVYSRPMLDNFFSNTVIKVSLYPDGSYAALAQDGGEVVGIRLGKQKMSVDGPTYATDGWGMRAGEYQIPKRAQKLALTFAARGQEMTVECETRFSRSEHAITFFVGPMNGLQCLGLTDDSVLSAAELVRSAEAQVARAAPASGS